MIASSHRATALAIAALAVPVLAAGATEARTVKPYNSETYETKGPARGLRRLPVPRLLLLLQALPQPRVQHRRAGSRALPRHRMAAGADL